MVAQRENAALRTSLTDATAVRDTVAAERDQQLARVHELERQFVTETAELQQQVSGLEG